MKIYIDIDFDIEKRWKMRRLVRSTPLKIMGRNNQPAYNP